MKIIIETIPHEHQRYDTVGDWWWEDSDKDVGDRVLQLRVSELSSVFREFLIIFHELFEAFWCLRNGVSQKSVDRFDKAYERKRKRGDTSEPGDSPRAPYYVGHQLATGFERMACALLKEDWNEYDKEVVEL